jgi:hypothetical protein
MGQQGGRFGRSRPIGLEAVMSTNSEKDPKATPAPPSPAPAPDRKLEPGELTDEDLDKVSGGFAPQVSAGRIPSGGDPLL